MASPVASQKFMSRHKVDAFADDPADSTVLRDVGWVDMRDYEGIFCLVLATALTGNGTTVFKILANDQADGGGTDVEIKAHAVGSAPDAEGDYLVLEATAEEIAQECGEAGIDGRYVSAQIDSQNSADEAAIIYVRYGAKRPALNLTADYVS